MKFLRTLTLALVAAAVSFSAEQAFCQQEVDPDHYDQPIAAKSLVKSPSHKNTTQHKAHGKTSIASKSTKKHRSHTTA